MNDVPPPAGGPAGPEDAARATAPSDPVGGARRSLDRRLLGLEPTEDPCRTSFVLAPDLCRPDGALFGGTALAAALAMLERASDRPALWATVQFVASAEAGERVDLQATFGARGGYIDQLQVRGTVGDRVVFEAVGSAATGRPGGITGTGVVMPAVRPPEECPPHLGPGGVMAEAMSRAGHHRMTDYREALRIEDEPVERADDGGVGATGRQPGNPAGRGAVPGVGGQVLLWARVLDETATTAAKLGFLGDMVPLAVCRAAGAVGAGTSLDNSIRIARLVDTEWVLLDLQAHAAVDGYGYGVGHLWSPDGTLLATSSQTAKLFDIAAMLRRRGAAEAGGAPPSGALPPP